MANKRFDPLLAIPYVDPAGILSIAFRTQHAKLIEAVDALMSASEAVLGGTASYDPPSIAALGTVTTTIPVTGAAIGDPVQVSFSRSLAGVMLSGYVSAANVITATFFNPTAGAIDLGDGILTARVG